MTKAEIVDEIAERTGLTKKDVADTVDQFLEAVSRALASGKHIEIRGFGTFKVKDRKSRLARNPRTGESVPVPPRRVPVFKTRNAPVPYVFLAIPASKQPWPKSAACWSPATPAIGIPAGTPS